ncbi:hypothetical protein BDA96_10G337900, partial [Sorghum bicolor]
GAGHAGGAGGAVTAGPGIGDGSVLPAAAAAAAAGHGPECGTSAAWILSGPWPGGAARSVCLVKSGGALPLPFSG